MHPDVTQFVEQLKQQCRNADEGHHTTESSTVPPLVARVFRHSPIPSDPEEAAECQARLRLSFQSDRDEMLEGGDGGEEIFKPFVFAMGSDGLETLLQMAAASAATADRDVVSESLVDPVVARHFMNHLGIEGRWIDFVLQKEKRVFSLIVAPLLSLSTSTSAFTAVQATWDGVFQCAIHHCPPLEPYVKKYQDECRTTNMLDDFVKREEFIAKYKSVETVENADCHKHPTIFITSRRFLKNTDRSFVDFRIMLWSWFGCNHHFRGDGYTKQCNNGGNAAEERRGSSEFLLANQNILQLVGDSGAVVLPLPVAIGTQESEA